MTSRAPKRFTTGADEHDEIIDTVSRRDGDFPQKLAQDHIKASVEVRLALIREQKQGNAGGSQKIYTGHEPARNELKPR